MTNSSTITPANMRDLSPELVEEMRVHLQKPDGPFLILADELPDLETVKAARSDQRFTGRCFVDGSIRTMYIPASTMLKIVLQVLDWEHHREAERRREREMRNSCNTCTITLFDTRLTPSQEEAMALPTTASKRRHNPPFYDKFRKKSRGGYG